MKSKISKVHVDYGLGFPVIIHNAPLIFVNDVWALSLDQNKYNRAVCLALSSQPGLLTGSQVKFIRYYFRMTLKAFAKRFGVAHPTVVAWEKRGNHPTKMEWGTEKDIRLEICNLILGKPEHVGALFKKLMEKPGTEPAEVHVDLNTAA